MELLKIEFTNYNGENKDIKEFEALTSRHCYLMEHAELLIDVISFVLLVQLLFSCLIICLVGKYLKFFYYAIQALLCLFRDKSCSI